MKDSGVINSQHAWFLSALFATAILLLTQNIGSAQPGKTPLTLQEQNQELDAKLTAIVTKLDVLHEKLEYARGSRIELFRGLETAYKSLEDTRGVDPKQRAELMKAIEGQYKFAKQVVLESAIQTASDDLQAIKTETTASGTLSDYCPPSVRYVPGLLPRLRLRR